MTDSPKKFMTSGVLEHTGKLLECLPPAYSYNITGEDYRTACLAVMITQAINRLTEAVDRNTAAVESASLIGTEQRIDIS